MTTAEVKEAVRKRDGYKCVDCGMTREVHVERFGRDLHVHRVQSGSDYRLEGCVTVCFICHNQRHDKTADPNLVHERLEEKDTVNFSLRMPVDFLERIKAAAKRKNISAAAWLRLLASECLEQEPPPPRKQ